MSATHFGGWRSTILAMIDPNAMPQIAQIVVAAIFGGLGGAVFTWLANRRFRLPPILGLRLARREGERGRIRRSEDTFENARYYHLRVSNDRRRWSPASEVQVVLARVDELGPDGTFQPSWWAMSQCASEIKNTCHLRAPSVTSMTATCVVLAKKDGLTLCCFLRRIP